MASATRPAVNEEVRLFRWRHPERPVIPVIIDGIFPDNFPRALRFEIATDGSITDRPVTILGPDLREEADGRQLGLAKIVAGLIDVSSDDIYRRAERARRAAARLRNSVIAVLVVLIVASAGSGILSGKLWLIKVELLDVTLAVFTQLVDAGVKSAANAMPLAQTRFFLEGAEGMLTAMTKQGRNEPKIEHRKAIMLTTFSDNYRDLGQTRTAKHRLDEAQQIKNAQTRAARMVGQLRAMLAQDDSPETIAACNSDLARGIEQFWGFWFQRIAFPEHHLTSTSSHKWSNIDEGGYLNTLGGRLTGTEASILRPYPKWLYIEPVLPDLRGKSVLEVGSNNGFFSFRFVEAGAASVTGVDIVEQAVASATWSKGVLGHHNVEFLHTDFLLDLNLQPHDVVFQSEVHNHFLLPFYGLCRMVNLARETLIFDSGVSETPAHTIELASGWERDPARLVYHSFVFSDGLLLDFLNLIGIPPERVIRYRAPGGQHTLYVIDTRGVKDRRRELNYPEYLRRVIELEFVPPRV
jgi:2-polyprenyl-3-methyl-5-hydroxy-6-metoxy-1,4-benzoquinol methylase